jgi:shikimate dehydrogenase
MEIFGLIGKRLGHSFSRSYFTEKFAQRGRDAVYWNFEMPDIKGFPAVLQEFRGLKGLNVTVPYKEEVLPYLDEISEEARAIGAVNMIRISHDTSGTPHTKGFNTDYIGFRDSLVGFITGSKEVTAETLQEVGRRLHRALILGNGGAAKAVRYALQSLGVEVLTASRHPITGKTIAYSDITAELLSDTQLIVNATPLGMYPNIDAAPEIPYHLLNASHYCYDLTYNPAETLFMRHSASFGASVMNGLEMLHRQAEAAGFL